jgi:hypothetical protein
MAEVRAEVNDFAAGVAETCQQLGEILANADALMLQLPAVLEVEGDIAAGVLGTTEGATRNVLSLAVAEAMFANFPPTTVGLNHFVNVACAMKFLRPYRGGEYYVELPLGDAPDLVRARLSSDVPHAVDLLRRIDQVSLRLIEESGREKKDRRTEMKKLVPTFLSVVNAGIGETACEVRDRKQVVGNIRISILDGVVMATDAVGDDSIADLVDTAIPLNELEEIHFEQKSLKGAADADVKRMAALRRHLRNALTLARARVAWEVKKAAEAAAKANQPAAEPVAAPAPAPTLQLVPAAITAPKPVSPKAAARRARKEAQRAAKAAAAQAAPEAPAVEPVAAPAPAPEIPASADAEPETATPAPSEITAPATEPAEK